MFDWFGDFFVFAVAAVMSAFPGWLVAHFLPTDDLISMAVIAASIVISFPLAMLSQLDIGSMWGILSIRVVTSLGRCPFSWLTFFIETGAIVAACIAAAYFTSEAGHNPLLAAVPLGSMALLLYARLLGRLGWRLAESMPATS